MTNRIRGKKREEVINNWLKGVEDPNVEVKPTKQEGRYIVKAKKEEPKEVEPEKDSTTRSNSKQSLDNEYEYEYVYEEEETPENIHLNLQLQILSELRAMNEEKRLRHEQKQRNKQIKEQVQKQLYKERNKNYFEETPTVGRVDIKEPSQQNKTQVGERRRLNLLRKYY